MDNIYLFETIKESKYYLELRNEIRKFKKTNRLNIEVQLSNSLNNSETRSNQNEVIFSYEEIERLSGRRRTTEMKDFYNIYRNSSKQANIILLGDIIYELMSEKIDTLFIPFDGRIPCYEIEESIWCQLETLDLFVYPIIVNYNEKYVYNINLNQYANLKHKTNVFVEGSQGTIFNLVFPENNDKKTPFYLFGYKNEVFVSSQIQNK